jgi:hypothetical protein
MAKTGKISDLREFPIIKNSSGLISNRLIKSGNQLLVCLTSLQYDEVMT